MAGGEEKDPVALTAFTQIQTTGPFVGRESLGGDLEAERRSEWVTYAACSVIGGEVVEEPRWGEPGERGLTERDFHIGDPKFRDDLFAAHGRVLGIVGGEGSRQHAHP